MEPAEETGPLGRGDNLLEVPTLSDFYEEDEDVKATFKPRFSPLPRRRSSVSSDDAECEAPSTIARKVSFADAFGYDLVSVKEFDTWEIPITSQNDIFDDDVVPVEEFYLSSLFELPSGEEVLQKVHAQKVLLESIECVPGFSSMKGIIRVLNVSFEKSVYVRMSLDDWLSYYDILAEYVPESYDGETDQFFFKISLVPPYQKDGAKVQFCIRYETSVGTFWANNNSNNYVLSCHKKETLLETDKQPEDVSDKLKKSCLKTNQSKEEEELAISEAGTWNDSKAPDIVIPEIIYPQEDNFEESDDNLNDIAMEHAGDNEREVELLMSRHLIRTRGASSGDERNFNASEQYTFSNEEQRAEKELTVNKRSTDLHNQLFHLSTSSEDSLQQLGTFQVIDKYSTLCDLSHTSEVGQNIGSANVGTGRPYLQCDEVPSSGGLPETEQSETIHTTDGISSRQGMSLVDISKDEADSATRNEIESLFICEDVNTLKEAFKIGQDSISTECQESVQLVEPLDDNANPQADLNTLQLLRVTLDSLQADNTDQNQEELVEMVENAGKVHITDTGLHAFYFTNSGTCDDCTETPESEKDLAEKRTHEISTCGNAKGEQTKLDDFPICAIKEEEVACLLEMNDSNLQRAQVEPSEGESSHLMSILSDSTHDLSAINTPTQVGDILMNTCVGDERSHKESYKLMSVTWHNGMETSEGKTNQGQEITSSVTESNGKEMQSELSNALTGADRKYPCSLNSTVTIFPVGYCKSFMTVDEADSSNSIVHNTENVSVSKKLAQKTIETLASEHTESQNKSTSTLRNTLQAECSPTSVKSEQSDCVMRNHLKSGPLEKQKVDISDSQSTEIELNRNETGSIQEQTNREGMRGESQRSLQISSTEGLLISQETLLCDDESLLADRSIKEERHISKPLLMETPFEQSVTSGESVTIGMQLYEIVQSEKPKEGEESVLEMQEATIDRAPYTQTDQEDMNNKSDIENQSILDSCRTYIDETLQEDAMSSVEGHQKTEYNTINLSPIDDIVLATVPKEVVLPQELYIEESLEQQEHVTVTLASKGNSTLNSNNDMQLPHYETDLLANNHHESCSATSPRVFDAAVVSLENNTQPPTAITSLKSNENICDGSSYHLTTVSEESCICSTMPLTDVLSEASMTSSVLPSNDKWETTEDMYFHKPDTRPEQSLGPVILISETNDKMEEGSSNIEEGSSDIGEFTVPQTMLESPDDKQETHQVVGVEAISENYREETSLSSESAILKRVGIKVLYFLMFVIFAVIIYQYDLMLCCVLYFLSLYVLFWEKGTRKESVKKE